MSSFFFLFNKYFQNCESNYSRKIFPIHKTERVLLLQLHLIEIVLIVTEKSHCIRQKYSYKVVRQDTKLVFESTLGSLVFI